MKRYFGSPPPLNLPLCGKRLPWPTFTLVQLSLTRSRGTLALIKKKTPIRISNIGTCNKGSGSGVCHSYNDNDSNKSRWRRAGHFPP